MHTIKINGKRLKVKSSWTELSRKELSKVFAIKFSVETLTIIQKLQILVIISELTDRIISVLTPDQAHRILNLIRWVWRDNLTERPFNFITAGKVKYYLPADGFADTSAGEIAMFNIYNLQFLNQASVNEETRLQIFYTILAQLCRPERKDLETFRNSIEWNGDKREPYNSAKADEISEVLKKVPMAELMAIYQWLMTVNNAFLERNKELFAEGKGEPIFGGGEGWIALIEDVAGMGKFGDFDKVFDMNGPSMFLHVRLANKRASKMKA